MNILKMMMCLSQAFIDVVVIIHILRKHKK